MGELYNSIKYREQYHNEDWMMVIVTDHGRDVTTGRNHGRQSERERTIWIATNKKELNKYFYAHTPAMVDVLPSVARHLNMEIPEANGFELDGVPFVGEISIAEPTARIVNDKLRLEWTPFELKGKVEVLVTTTNRFETGGKPDEYRSLGSLNIASGRAEIGLDKELLNAGFLKIVLKAEKNTVNRWIVR